MNMKKSEQLLKQRFEKEPTYREIAAKSSFVRPVPATYPGGVFDRPMGSSCRIFTPEMKGSLWGQPDCLTLSMLKTDVYDRRYFRRKPVTLEELMEGAFSPANKDFDDMPHRGLTRPVYGTLLKEGGRFDAEAWSELYPFPCQKAVGQLIIRAGDFKGAPQPDAVHSMSDGTAKLNVSKGGASMQVKYLMGMKRNVVAANVEYAGLAKALSFCVYRHQDQGHRRYMDENGNFIPKEERKVVYHPTDRTKPVGYYDYEADASFNGPFEPPVSGTDGRFFWIEQKFPADRTFPGGFRYILMGLVSDTGAKVTAQPLGKNLGTPPLIPRDSQGKLIFSGTLGHDNEIIKMETAFSLVRNAPGVAGTAELSAAGSGEAVAYITVVTVREAEDYMEQAKKNLLQAEAMGFDGLRAENRDWYNDLYDRRENGRIILDGTRGKKKEAAEQLFRDAYLSWSYGHGGYCSPNPAKLQGGAGYAAFEVDTQSWHSLPCYNELFTEGRWFVHNQYEIMYMWPNLVTFWKEALMQKAADMYGLPGLVMGHGYLPPATPDPWYIENQTLDFCVEVPGQVMKVIWNLWDYTGDEKYLKETAYPLLRELAIFYEAFARRGWDGKQYNLLPAVETESYGISYGLKFAKNTTAAITMFRKILNLACEAAEYLHVDQDLIPGFREVAEHLPPYPTFDVGMGKILAGNPGAMLRWQAGDHEINSANYPATLADEITLDSPREDKELIIRTADTVRTAMNNEPYILVGCFAGKVPCGYNMPAVTIENEETLASELIRTPERLLNSRSGRIHLFPAVPGWSDVAFRNMLARGGFEVSAMRDESGIQAVTVGARRDNVCRMMNPWPGRDVVITDLTDGAEISFELDRTNGECLIWKARAGHCYSVDRN